MANGDQIDLSAGVVNQAPGGIDLSAGVVKAGNAPAAPPVPAAPAGDPNQTPQAVAARHARANVGRNVPTAADVRASQNEAPTLGQAGAALIHGGIEFVNDIMETVSPNLMAMGRGQQPAPISESQRIGALIKKYVTDPFDEQRAASDLAATRGDTAGVLAHAVGAGIPFAGPVAGTAFDNFRKAHTLSQYAGAGLYAAAAALSAKGMAEGVATSRSPIDPTVADVARAATDRQAVVEGTHLVLEKSAKNAQLELTKAKAKVGAKIGELVNTIADSDISNSFGADELGSIEIGPAFDALIEAQEKYNPGKGNTASVKAATQELGRHPERVSWEDAKGIRTDIGSMIEKVPAREAATLTALYDNLTKQMADRAGELGLEKEFDAYNTLHEKMTDHVDGVFGDLMKANTGLEFFDTIRKPSNGPALKNLAKDLSDFGLSQDFFSQLKDAHQASYRVAKNSEGADISMGGKMKAFMTHPAAAGTAAVAAGAAASGIPVLGMAGRFVLTLLAAAKAADLVDIAKASAEMRLRGGVPPVTGTFGGAAKVGAAGGTPPEEPPAPAGKPGAAAARPEASAAKETKFSSRSREELSTKESSPEEQAQALRVESQRLEESLRSGRGTAVERVAAKKRLQQNREMIAELEDQEIDREQE